MDRIKANGNFDQLFLILQFKSGIKLKNNI